MNPEDGIRALRSAAIRLLLDIEKLVPTNEVAEFRTKIEEAKALLEKELTDNIGVPVEQPPVQPPADYVAPSGVATNTPSADPQVEIAQEVPVTETPEPPVSEPVQTNEATPPTEV